MKKPTVVKWVNVKCPACGFVFNKAGMLSKTAPKGTTPRPGSSVLCFNCGEFLKVADDLQLRKPTPEEMKQIQKTSWFMDAFTDSLIFKSKFQNRN